jgi:hypothetical protein
MIHYDHICMVFVMINLPNELRSAAITSLTCRCQFGPADVILHAAASGRATQATTSRAL